MKVLFVGGTGTISTACARLAVDRGMDVYLLNRGNREVTVTGAQTITADIHNPESVRKALGEQSFDVIAQFIVFKEEGIERDLDLFRGRCGQYFFISSASVYQKPLVHPVITESTPLKNPYWQYSRDKIACEERLVRAYREEDFPMVIVRPSHTYDHMWPVAMGSAHDFTMIDRMRRGRPVVVHGDGTSLWTVTHSDDFAKGFVGLFGNHNANGHAFHITSDERLTWNQIYRTIADAAGAPEPQLVHIPSEFLAALDESNRGSLLGDKAHTVLFDNSKIKRFVPDFCASIPYNVGARRTLQWFEADAARQKVSDEVHATIDGYFDMWQRACTAAGVER